MNSPEPNLLIGWINLHSNRSPSTFHSMLSSGVWNVSASAGRLAKTLSKAR
ncbi:hypothetical protein D3C85_1590900 [compost metagenome]